MFRSYQNHSQSGVFKLLTGTQWLAHCVYEERGGGVYKNKEIDNVSVDVYLRLFGDLLRL